MDCLDLIFQLTIKLHPNWYLHEFSFNYDIGLIKLERRVIFGPDLSPICLKVTEHQGRGGTQHTSGSHGVLHKTRHLQKSVYIWLWLDIVEVG